VNPRDQSRGEPYAQTDLVRSTDGGDSWKILRQPSGDDVLESLGFVPGAPANEAEHGRFEAPIGNLSVKRVPAAAAGLACFTALWVFGAGGRRVHLALVLRLGGGVVALAVALVVLAA
jgi:hypothetical protein